MAERPFTLIAELSYRCPLRCAYCSNPVEFGRHSAELDTDTWERVLEQAEGLGVVQVHFTGGEPLLRRDLERLVSKARELDLYTSLVTSGLPVDLPRLERLRDSGLDHVQLSFQGPTKEHALRWASRDTYEQKIQVARRVRELDLPLTINMVVHRDNIHDIARMIEQAESIGAERIELANALYLGWALENREALLPSRAQIDEARAVVAEARTRLRGALEIDFILPDYYAEYPRACMEGWGRRYILVSPDGLILPCHAAHTLPELSFDNVRETPLGRAWASSPALETFRGDEWMTEPCRSCARRELDFGGCRCQAFHLVGRATATDPACHLAPDHAIVERARASAQRRQEDAVVKLRARRSVAGRS